VELTDNGRRLREAFWAQLTSLRALLVCAVRAPTI
jgi:hypothetical protein